MEIKTERLTLKPHSMEYLESTHRYASDLENTRFMFYLPNGTLEETEAFIRRSIDEWGKEKPEYYEFVILRGDTQVGGASMYILEDGSAELGWILDKRHWGRGYATEAARALLEWGRDSLGIRRFIAQCDSENTASWHMMERLGMRRVSLLGGRKNRSSDEERMELTYEIMV